MNEKERRRGAISRAQRMRAESQLRRFQLSMQADAVDRYARINGIPSQERWDAIDEYQNLAGWRSGVFRV